MIPEGSIKVRVNTNNLLEPDSKKYSGLFDYELGGEDIGNTDLGFLVRTWKVEVINGDVTLFRDEVFHSVLFYDSSIVDIALAFDQSMQVVLAWQTLDGSIYLRYYDSVSLSYAVMSVGIGKCPRLSLDDKRSEFISTCDVIFAYISEGSLRYRQQRESYLTEHIVVGGLSDVMRLERIGMGGLQFQFELKAYVG